MPTPDSVDPFTCVMLKIDVRDQSVAGMTGLVMDSSGRVRYSDPAPLQIKRSQELPHSDVKPVDAYFELIQLRICGT
jgi:hypothetical protein